MELVAFVAIGLVIGAVAIYSEIFEPSSQARTAAATEMMPPEVVPPDEFNRAPVETQTAALAVPPMIEPAAGPAPTPVEPGRQPVQPALMMMPRPEPIELPDARRRPSRQDTQPTREGRQPRSRQQRTQQAAADDRMPRMIEPAAGPPRSKPSRRDARREKRESRNEIAAARGPASSRIAQQQPDSSPVEQLAQNQPSNILLAQRPVDAPRPFMRGGQPVYAAETPEGLMDLACFELISGDRSFVGPEGGAFLARFDIERVSVTCRYGILEGPATYVLSPNRIYGYNGTIWANVWRMLPRDVRELRVRFEGRELTDRRSRSPRRSSTWDGDAVGFDPQGRVLLMARFDQGNFDGPLQVRAPNGTTVFTGSFKALPEGGVPHGVFRLSNAAGRLIARRYFCNGYPVGVHQFYSTRGDVIAREDYRNTTGNLGDCPWRTEGEATNGRNSGA